MSRDRGGSLSGCQAGEFGAQLGKIRGGFGVILVSLFRLVILDFRAGAGLRLLPDMRAEARDTAGGLCDFPRRTS